MSQSENIQKELESLSSPLANMPKGQPFAVPEGYFARMIEELTATIAQEDELPRTSIPFEAPEGYLDTLPDQLRDTALKADKSKKVIPLSPIRKLSRIAAAAILLMGLGFGVNSYFRAKAPESVAARHLSKVDKESISTYVSHQWGGVDLETGAAVAESANNETHDAIAKLKSSEIREYLNEHRDVGMIEMDEETL